MNTPSWTDAHCHLQHPRFGTRLCDVFRRSETFAIRRWVVNGTHPDDWPAVAQLARTHAGISPQFGVHPWNAATLPPDWPSRLKACLLEFPGAGVGEIGLDRKLTRVPIETQLPVCVEQLNIARGLGRPCTLHIVGAWAELQRAFSDSRPDRFLLHSFSGSAEQAGLFSRQGAWFSFGGAVIRHANSRKLLTALRAVPEDRLLLETDAPFQHPDGHNACQEPAGLLPIAEAVARIRGIPVDRLREITEANADRFLASPVPD